MSNVPMAGAGGAPPGWYPQYGHSSAYQPPPSHHQTSYPSSGQHHPPSQQQAHHPGIYAGNSTHPQPPATHHHSSSHQAHPQSYPTQHHSQSYQQYPPSYPGYPNPSSTQANPSGNSGGSGGAYQQHSAFSDAHYANSSYQYHQQPPYNYQHQPYGYPPPPIAHHMSEDSTDKSMGNDHRPPSELEYHQGHDPNLPPHSTPRPDSRLMGQYGYYGPPSGGPPAAAEHHPQYRSASQHTPIYPSSSGEQLPYTTGPGSASSTWMNFPVATPNAPTPQAIPTPNTGSNLQPNHLYHQHGIQGTSPQSMGNQHSQIYYASQQQYHPSSIGQSGSFPAPPPFPYQERRPSSVPPGAAGGPSARYDQPPSSMGNAFEPPASEYAYSDRDQDDEKSKEGVKQSKEKALDGTRRRFLFGSQGTAAVSNSPETSQRKSDSERMSMEREAKSSNFIPPNADIRNTETPRKESKNRNSLQAKFEDNSDNDNTTKGETSSASDSKRKRSSSVTIGTTKTPSFDDASLLLGLRTHSNSNSPETVPATVSQDSNEDSYGKGILTQKSEDKSEVTKASSDSAGKGDKTSNDADIDDPSLPAYSPAPNTNNMVPVNYPKRLALANDAVKLNSLHCLIRSELLEIFVIEPSSLKNTRHIYAPTSSVGRVGLRCVHCAMARRKFQESNVEKQDIVGVETGTRMDSIYSEPTDGSNIARDDEAPMAVFYPKSVAEIYRLITSWQRCHLRKCKNVPPPVRAEWNERRVTDKTRGKTNYWISSSREIGLIDCTSRAGGIRFRIRIPNNVDSSNLKEAMEERNDEMVTSVSMDEPIDKDLAVKFEQSETTQMEIDNVGVQSSFPSVVAESEDAAKETDGDTVSENKREVDVGIDETKVKKEELDSTEIATNKDRAAENNENEDLGINSPLLKTEPATMSKKKEESEHEEAFTSLQRNSETHDSNLSSGNSQDAVDNLVDKVEQGKTQSSALARTSSFDETYDCNVSSRSPQVAVDSESKEGTNEHCESIRAEITDETHLENEAI